MIHGCLRTRLNHLLRNSDQRNSKRSQFLILDLVACFGFGERMPVASIALDCQTQRWDIEVDDMPPNDLLRAEFDSTPLEFLSKRDFNRTNSRSQFVSPNRCAVLRAGGELSNQGRLHLTYLAAYLARHLDLFFEERVAPSFCSGLDQGFTSRRTRMRRIVFVLPLGDMDRFAAFITRNDDWWTRLHGRQVLGIEDRSTGVRTEAVRVVGPLNLEFPATFFTMFCCHIGTFLGKAISDGVGTVRETVRRMVHEAIPSPLNSKRNSTRSGVLIPLGA